MKFPFRSKKYLRQITAYIAGILLILSILFGLFFHFNNRKLLLQKIQETELQQSQNTLLQIDAYIAQLLAIANEFASFHIPADQLSITNNFWARTLLQEYLNSFPSTNSYIINIDLTLDSIALSPSAISHDLVLAEYNTFTIYSSASTAWPYYIDFTSSFKSPYNSVSITVDSYQLSWNIFNYQDRNRRTYLLSRDNIVLLTNHRQTFHTDIYQYYENLSPLMESSSDTALQTYGDYYCILSAPDSYGFRILSLIPADSYTWQFDHLNHQTLLLTIVFIGIVLAASIIIIKKFYTPIQDMISLLNIYIPNELQEYDNEITYIRESIQKYLPKPDTSPPPLQQRLNQMHSAQSAVMQHQINNHFLFNTLENIKTISIDELGKGNEIEEAIMHLKTIVQEGIRQKSSLVPLSHELNLVRAYVKLMALRFPDIETSITADTALDNCTVFKFSIQPILENCFSHAFTGDTDGEKRIAVQIYREENSLVIAVSDNGTGLDAASIQTINALLSDDSQLTSANHVGLQNVHRRIVSVFGPHYGVSFQNSETGTSFTIRYPIEDYHAFPHA